MNSMELRGMKILCAMVACLILVLGITAESVSAASNGIYLATAESHYRHPVTGKIEDSGGEANSVLGQSMTESALHSQALVEVDPDGNTFLTIRLKLMDNIQDPHFQVDVNQNGNFSPISSVVMQEDLSNNTSDFRMQIPSENAIIRCNMYVTAMGREVVFYITVGNFQSGSGDFIASVEVAAPSTASTPQATSDAPAQTPAAPISPTENTSTTTDSSSHSESSSLPESSSIDSSISSETESKGGLQEFDKTGKQVNSKTEITPDSSSGVSHTWIWAVAIVFVLVAGGGVAWYLLWFRKRRGQEKEI